MHINVSRGPKNLAFGIFFWIKLKMNLDSFCLVLSVNGLKKMITEICIKFARVLVKIIRWDQMWCMFNYVMKRLLTISLMDDSLMDDCIRVKKDMILGLRFRNVAVLILCSYSFPDYEPYWAMVSKYAGGFWC